MYRTCLFFLLALGLALPVSAGEIYRWYDGEGRPVFGDSPGLQPAERLDVTVPTGRTAAEPPPGQSQTPVTNPPATSSAASDCAAATERLARFQSAEYLYRDDGSDNRTLLSDAERTTVIERQRARAETACAAD